MAPIDLTATAAAGLFAQEVLKGLGGQVANTTWSGLTRLVRFIEDRFHDDPHGREVVDGVQAEPDDQQRVTALAEFLAVRAAEDPSFREELTGLLAEASHHRVAGRFATDVSGNARVGKLTNIDTVPGDVSF